MKFIFKSVQGVYDGEPLAWFVVECPNGTKQTKPEVIDWDVSVWDLDTMEDLKNIHGILWSKKDRVIFVEEHEYNSWDDIVAAGWADDIETAFSFVVPDEWLD